MADIHKAPVLRHLRGAPTSYVRLVRGGRVVQEGVGLAFWFRPLSAIISEVPVDDRDVPFVASARTRDLQVVKAQGTITYRVVDPALALERIDFGIDPDTGSWRAAPLEQVAGLLVELVQQRVLEELTTLDLRDAITGGAQRLRTCDRRPAHGRPAPRRPRRGARARQRRRGCGPSRPRAARDAERGDPAGADKPTFEQRGWPSSVSGRSPKRAQNQIELAAREQSPTRRAPRTAPPRRPPPRCRLRDEGAAARASPGRRRRAGSGLGRADRPPPARLSALLNSRRPPRGRPTDARGGSRSASGAAIRRSERADGGGGGVDRERGARRGRASSTSSRRRPGPRDRDRAARGRARGSDGRSALRASIRRRGEIDLLGRSPGSLRAGGCRASWSARRPWRTSQVRPRPPGRGRRSRAGPHAACSADRPSRRPRDAAPAGGDRGAQMVRATADDGRSLVALNETLTSVGVATPSTRPTAGSSDSRPPACSPAPAPARRAGSFRSPARPAGPAAGAAGARPRLVRPRAVALAFDRRERRRGCRRADGAPPRRRDRRAGRLRRRHRARSAAARVGPGGGDRRGAGGTPPRAVRSTAYRRASGAPPPRRRRGGRARSASAARRRGRRRCRCSSTRAPSTGPAPSPSRTGRAGCRRRTAPSARSGPSALIRRCPGGARRRGGGCGAPSPRPTARRR